MKKLYCKLENKKKPVWSKGECKECKWYKECKQKRLISDGGCLQFEIAELWPNIEDDVEALCKKIAENPFPTYTEAKAIVDNAEIVNEGTDHEFVKGCYSLRYKNAVMRLSMTVELLK